MFPSWGLARAEEREKEAKDSCQSLSLQARKKEGLQIAWGHFPVQDFCYDLAQKEGKKKRFDFHPIQSSTNCVQTQLTWGEENECIKMSTWFLLSSLGNDNRQKGKKKGKSSYASLIISVELPLWTNPALNVQHDLRGGGGERGMAPVMWSRTWLVSFSPGRSTRKERGKEKSVLILSVCTNMT